MLNTSPIIRERYIKTTMRYNFTPTRLVLIKRQIIRSVGENVEKLEL